jgi:hypothetical protein
MVAPGGVRAMAMAKAVPSAGDEAFVAVVGHQAAINTIGRR